MDAGNFESEDDKDEAVFLVQRASEAITEWKAHQLRCINQDRAQLEVLSSLDSTGVLIVQDFTMKFMPLQYREAQNDFFGKQGLSWHVSVCHRKVGGKLESQTFIHILQTGLQETTAVVLIMDHVRRLLKKQHPEIVRSCFQQNNARCYHSAKTILSVDILSKRSGIQVNDVDFSDPQGGKGSCDRKAAQIKSHVKSYVNEGHSVTNVRELKPSRGGIPGVRVTVVKVHSMSSQSYKLDSISSLNNFKFTTGGFTAFPAYDLGPGKFFPWSSFESGIV